ncbi:terpenoid synthase [Punctularia strigosozonata HHB-11173 SS5]|uniref:Terpene synthase n=1 Tax=Punctularia strigosozonata (strain HHB-11173) TaxID=741275 RepID=R7S1P2_PUNST|nr:terpenoid synthase [Punctularia strigosozonata HHB-11173 SS5]EIN03697.1 terpenoid synthase [Punctularia strigosozonata HHB-11173 SS5]
MPSATHFYLPDLHAVCPLKGSTNPHYKQAGAESSAWINSYNVFTDRKRAFFVQGCNELLVSHTYPYAGYEEFRTTCDFVNLLFVVDEVSDDQDGEDARKTGNVFLNAMRHDDWLDGSALAKMTKDFRTRFLRLAGPACARRFLNHCDKYIEAVSREAEYREHGLVLDVEAFTNLRRENSAIRLCFGLFEAVLGIDLPDYVFEDATFMSLYWAAADMVCWSNDVYSYDMEQAKGLSGNNIVTVLMQANGTTLQETSDYIGEYFRDLMDRFTAKKAMLPSWTPQVDAAVARYVAAMEHWVIGNLIWSFETQRYFGPRHEEVKATRLVVLRPREDPGSSDEEIQI